MNIKKVLTGYYNIIEPLKIRETEYGSGNTFVIESKLQKYILKKESSSFDLKLYIRVQEVLSSYKIIQSKIIITNDGQYITPCGHVLYEYIEGETSKFFSDKMRFKAIEYICKYNKVLRKIEYREPRLESTNDWELIKSINYICNESIDRVKNLDLEKSMKYEIITSINMLNDKRNLINDLDLQLIHSDLGADNFIVLNNDIKAIIDFTPQKGSEFYSLAQFIYWEYLWNEDNWDTEVINKYLCYYKKCCKKDFDEIAFYLLLLIASIYRTLGAVFELKDCSSVSSKKIVKRIKIMKGIKNVLAESF